MTISISFPEFLKKFHEEYSFLYEHHNNVAGYREAVAAFDVFAPAHKILVSEFCKLRGDFISSDREAAAFMFALEPYL